jgi:YebC/PmpR family DNA-binding regulatory protein
MSGHNKWSKIKHKKAAADSQKSKMFGKLAALIAIESKKVGGDTSSPNLRAVIDKARAANMPMANINRAVERGKGADGAALEQVIYEAYGPGGAAIVIEALTDNRNRSNAEIKHLLITNGASPAAPGSAMWIFEKNEEGYLAKIKLDLSDSDIKAITDLIEKIEEHSDVSAVYTNTNV